MSDTQECIFCQIANKEIESRVIYENEQVVAILDVRPFFAKGQCVVIPKRHVELVYNLEGDEIVELFKAVRIVAEKIKAALNLPWALILIRGKGISHAHVIVFPTNEKEVFDKFTQLIAALQSLLSISEGELDELARQIQDIDISEAVKGSGS